MSKVKTAKNASGMEVEVSDFGALILVTCIVAYYQPYFIVSIKFPSSYFCKFVVQSNIIMCVKDKEAFCSTNHFMN